MEPAQPNVRSHWRRLGVLAELADKRRKIGVSGDDHECVDVFFGVAEVERVNDHANICRVLAGLANMRDLNELESGFVHRGLELLVAIPIAIRLLDDNAAL